MSGGWSMNAKAASANDWIMAKVWIPIRSLRLSERSATTPAHAPKMSTGRNWAAVINPTATPLCVRWSTSRVWVINVIQLPACETICPPKKRRKLRMRNERNVSLAACLARGPPGSGGMLCIAN